MYSCMYLVKVLYRYRSAAAAAHPVNLNNACTARKPAAEQTSGPCMIGLSLSVESARLLLDQGDWTYRGMRLLIGMHVMAV